MSTMGQRHARPRHARAAGRRRTALVAVTTLVSVSLVAVAPAPEPAVAAGEPEQVPVAAVVTGTDGQADPAAEQPADDVAPAQPTAPAPQQPAEDPAPQQPAEDPAPQQPAEPAAAAGRAAATPAPDAAAPLAVPSPSEESSVINVRVGGDRTGGTTVGPLAGVTLNLWDGNSFTGPTTPRTEDWATCTSDAQGDCTFVVPDTQFRGANYERHFWVVQAGAPAGWYSNPSLVTGTADDHGPTQYRFMTPELHAGETYVSGNPYFMGSAWSIFGHAEDSGGLWQNSRVNPALPQTCSAGLDVALVLDLSGSVGNAGALDDLKASAIAFAESLEGTGSRLALYTFATHAPRSADATGTNYPLTDVDRNLQTIRSRINAYEAGGGTNWDRGIYQVATSADTYDVAIVVTDGLSTFFGPDAEGSGSSTRFVETEQAIASANALKAKGTRVLAVGVGEGVSGESDNLRAISGPTPHTTSARNADYFQTGWQELAGVLSSVARGATCRAEITVDKIAEPYAGTAGPGAGWTFDASTQGGAAVAPVRGEVTGTAGTVEYIVSFDRPDAAASTVRLEELISQDQRADGWSLTGLACTANGVPLTTVRVGDGTSVPAAVGDDIACTFTNKQRLVPGIEIVKQAWDTPAADGLDGAEELPAGATVSEGTRLTWTYTVRNTGRTALEGIRVSDDQGVTVTCPRQRLGVGEHMVCTGSGPVSARP
ncbi:VWA domain-containing protein [Georgenia wutianyii]|uniref:VWA domain-containing protein n=2 Tax=Georgenia wutianyii TaxID=2585135 RepID=A0ABX5VP39_9MICO|nr:VWA domain-containing protein [Georgenia wutianyii]